MNIEILNEVAINIAGDKARGIIDILFNKQNVNEFLISKKLKLTINSTRNILYKLADEGLVSFVRKKDNKKGGWYIYFWTLNEEKGLMKFRDDLIAKNEVVGKDFSLRTSQRYYYCSNCNLEFNEEESLANSYTCPECGEILILKDNSKDLQASEKEIKKNQELLEKVNLELSVLQEKYQKSKDRKLKLEEKKKKEERDEKRRLRKKEKEKLAKKEKAHSKKKTKKK